GAAVERQVAGDREGRPGGDADGAAVLLEAVLEDEGAVCDFDTARVQDEFAVDLEFAGARGCLLDFPAVVNDVDSEDGRLRACRLFERSRVLEGAGGPDALNDLVVGLDVEGAAP